MRDIKALRSDYSGRAELRLNSMTQARLHGIGNVKSASVYQSECGSGFRLAPTCSFIRNGRVLPRVSKAGVRLLHKDGQDTIAEIVEFYCISIFPGAAFSSGYCMIKDVIIHRTVTTSI